MGKLVVIACSKSKLDRPAAARALYTGAMFRMSVRWAEQRGLPWVVLSSRHGVVWPDQQVAPYRSTVAKGLALAGEEDGVALTPAEKAAGRTVVALVSRAYAAALEGAALRVADGRDEDRPAAALAQAAAGILWTT